MALRRSLLRIDKASLLETFSSLKIRNFGYTPSCLQLLRKLMSNFNLFFVYSSFSYFAKIFNCNISIFTCNIVVDIKKYLNYKFSGNQNQLKDKSDVHYFKLPYIGNLSHHIKNKLSKLCKEFSKENFNIKLVFNSFKIKNYFAYKDPIPNDLKSFLVYKFTCASCSSSYIGETCRHFKTRIEENIKKDNKSHIFNINNN